MIASALARIDALTEEVGELKSRLRVQSELTADLMRMISVLEAERDTWRAKASQP